MCNLTFCGEGGIRTHGTVAGTPPFQGGQFNHSCTSPHVVHKYIKIFLSFQRNYTFDIDFFYRTFTTTHRFNGLWQYISLYIVATLLSRNRNIERHLMICRNYQ